jgi:GT2 family glycosyltransferase
MSSTMSAPPVAAVDLPRAAAVPHNRWDRLKVPPLGAWRPSLVVTVVVPHYRAHAELDRTMHALAAQTYPRELTEVIVVDDGSPEPPVVPASLGLDAQVVVQERRGFGAARARNLGASLARGEILVFLDADMLPEPGQLEAHARWHHVTWQAVTLGQRRHIDADRLDAGRVLTAARLGSLAPLFEGQEQQAPAWIEGHLRRTDGLLSSDADLFRVVTSGNLGVSARLFAACGGFDASFDRWGGEDVELGYRLFTAGGVLVPEPAAHCWHQGAGHEPDPEELRSLQEQRGKLAHLIAHRGFRRTVPGRSYLVPRLAVHVRGDAGLAATTTTIESVLATDLHDLVVVLDAATDPAPMATLDRQFGWDPRVVRPDQVPLATPFHLELPAGAVLGSCTATQLVDRLSASEGPVGVLDLTVPPKRPGRVRARAWSTRAMRRVGWDGRSAPEDHLEAAAELFGARWVSGHDVELGWRTVADGSPAVADAAPRRPDGDSRVQAQELWELLARLEPRQQQLLVGTAKQVLGSLGSRQLAVLLGLGRWGLGVLAAVVRFRRVRGVSSLAGAVRTLVRAVVGRAG